MDTPDKPKRRGRTATKVAPNQLTQPVIEETNGPAAKDKPRKPRVRKPTPSKNGSPVTPAVSVEVPELERLGATVPLPPLADSDYEVGFNGGMTVATADVAPGSPRRIVCQQVEAAYLSDVGLVRDNNEDSASAFLSTISRLNAGPEIVFGLLVVADGMGGHERGEVASNIAVRKLNEGVIQHFYVPTMEGQQPGRPGETPITLLADLIEDANQAIVQEAHQSRSGAMGTTLTCVVIVGQTALVGHVGDSRLYVLEKSSQQLQLVTHDHSVVQRLVDTGQMTVEEANLSPQRSMLYKSLGQRGQIDPDVGAISLNDVEYMMLCSDGLWDMIEDDQIEQILRKASGPGDAAAMLVAAANANGGADNVTVVVAKF